MGAQEVFVTLEPLVRNDLHDLFDAGSGTSTEFKRLSLPESRFRFCLPENCPCR